MCSCMYPTTSPSKVRLQIVANWLEKENRKPTGKYQDNLMMNTGLVRGGLSDQCVVQDLGYSPTL